MAAPYHGHTTIVAELLEVQGLEIEAPNDQGNTALLCAAINGHTAIFEMLEAAGANVHHINVAGETALICASRGGHISMVEALLDRDVAVAYTSQNGRTALMHASENGHVDVVEALLTKGMADINITNNHNETALTLAAAHSHPEVLNVLLAHGATLDPLEESAITAMRKAVETGHEDQFVVRLDNATDNSATTPIKFEQVLHHLVAAGADCHVPQELECSPYLLVMDSGVVRVAKLMVACGFDIYRIRSIRMKLQ